MVTYQSIRRLTYIKYELQNCKQVRMPSDTNEKLSISMLTEDNDVTGKVPYQELIGSLLYISQCTRPDISFAVNNASRFNSKHCDIHWRAVLRILKYLRGTSHLKLKFTSAKEDICARRPAETRTNPITVQDVISRCSESHHKNDRQVNATTL